MNPKDIAIGLAVSVTGTVIAYFIIRTLDARLKTT